MALDKASVLAQRPSSRTPSRSIPSREVGSDTGRPTNPAAVVTHTRLRLAGSIATITRPDGTSLSSPDKRRPLSLEKEKTLPTYAQQSLVQRRSKQLSAEAALDLGAERRSNPRGDIYRKPRKSRGFVVSGEAARKSADSVPPRHNRTPELLRPGLGADASPTAFQNQRLAHDPCVGAMLLTGRASGTRAM